VTKVGLAVHRTFHSLHTRNFRLFFLGQAVSVTGTWMQAVAAAWLVLQLTGSGVALGIETALTFAPILFIGGWAGGMADRHDKRTILIATQIAFSRSRSGERSRPAWSSCGWCTPCRSSRAS